MTEFELIGHYFGAWARGVHGAARDGLPLQSFCPDQRVQLGIGDDCAMVRLDERDSLVVSVDTQVEGRHFPRSCAPAHVASRALGAAVSDLAAMGAEPIGCWLALTLPSAVGTWLEAFSLEFRRLTELWNVPLLGGDTTAGPLQVSITVLGRVETAKALRRGAARAGDDLWVSGCLGEASAALAFLENDSSVSLSAVSAGIGTDSRECLLHRYHHPEPRLALGRWLLGRASAAIDISDGLLADLGHLCAASGIGARLDLEALPVSDALRAAAGLEKARHFMLQGGDDYELCFAAPVDQRDCIGESGWDVWRIGQFTSDLDILICHNGSCSLAVPEGFDHFRPTPRPGEAS